MEVKEIGACNAILSGIRTKVDGSISITLDINPEDQKILSKLLQLYATNERLLTIGLAQVVG
jgi:hypothetical protein